MKTIIILKNEKFEFLDVDINENPKDQVIYDFGQKLEFLTASIDVVVGSRKIHITKNGALCIKQYLDPNKKNYRELVIYPNRIVQKSLINGHYESCVVPFKIDHVGGVMTRDELTLMEDKGVHTLTSHTVNYSNVAGEYLAGVSPDFIEVKEKGADAAKFYEFAETMKDHCNPISSYFDPSDAYKVICIINGHGQGQEGNLPSGASAADNIGNLLVYCKAAGRHEIMDIKTLGALKSKKLTSPIVKPHKPGKSNSITIPPHNQVKSNWDSWFFTNPVRGGVPVTIAVGFTAAIVALECVKPFLYLALTATAVPAILAVVFVATQTFMFTLHHTLIKDYKKEGLSNGKKAEFSRLGALLTLGISITALCLVGDLLAYTTAAAPILLMVMASLMLAVNVFEMLGDFCISHRARRHGGYVGMVNHTLYIPPQQPYADPYSAPFPPNPYNVPPVYNQFAGNVGYPNNSSNNGIL